MPEYRPYKVAERIEEAPGVSTFLVRPVEGKRSPFEAGQFINIALPGFTEAKSYTIASAPHQNDLAITVRAAGAFSTALLNHKVGDELLLTEPLGYFCAEESPAPQLWLAGGIGITPFMSMLREVQSTLPQTVLYYSNRTVEDIVFKQELEQSPINVRHFITREPPQEGMSPGRIAEADLQEALHKLPGCRVYICGSVGFVRDYWSLLKRLGVPESSLFTEAFF